MLGSIGKKNDEISFVSFGKLHIDCLTEKVPSKAVCSKDFRRAFRLPFTFSDES